MNGWIRTASAKQKDELFSENITLPRILELVSPSCRFQWLCTVAATWWWYKATVWTSYSRHESLLRLLSDLNLLSTTFQCMLTILGNVRVRHNVSCGLSSSIFFFYFTFSPCREKWWAQFYPQYILLRISFTFVWLCLIYITDDEIKMVNCECTT